MTKSIWTATLARLYTQQRLWDQAACVYRELVAREPDRQDLREELAQVEAHLAKGRMEKLLQRWVELLFDYRRIRALRRLRSGLHG
ncbi:MAG: hypothetical protein WHT06_10760 [Desulfobacterales bacterium]